eukprot:CAMPEP_0179000874 /NCGR_PEP_ID=MMETSP0795-20121207/10966_1 /TAXON_ID=88552 /ORGANISM="Amoebophrya sp., Strain Ameob2" /LENGTH=781 /DNA_ID=CAMNT_0020694023 /DNA_START=124 /DNA_END=2469 /DNA_ORIENTATION=+
MLPVTPGLSPESSASRAGVTSFDNVLPDFGEPAGLFLPSTLDPSNADAGIPNLPLAKEEAEKKQTDAIAKVLDQLTRKFLAKVFPPGAEVNNRDSLYGGRAGCAFLLVKNKSYFLSHDYFMSQLVEKLHYRHLDQAIADFLTPSITWGQDRKEKSSLLTGSMGLRFARLYHKWLVERETAYVTGTVQDEVDLNLLEENVNWMEYLPGEGEGFLCGRAGYLRALLWLLSASRYDKTTTRLLTMIEQNAAQMVESLGKFAREQPYETTAIGSSSVFVSLALRCRELTGTKNTLLRNSGDVGGSMGLIGIYYVLLLILREWNLRDLAVLEWQSELLDSLLFLESKENVWNGYPENLSEPWSGGRFTENTFNNGATGAVWLFALAHEVFQRDSFLKAAERAAEHTWKEAMTIAKVGIEEARRAPELSVALVQYDANGQKGKLADLQRQFHSSQQESSTQLLSANRLGHSTSVSGMGAYNNSSPIPPIPARATSRHRTHREVKAQSQMKDQNSREPMAGASSAVGGNDDGEDPLSDEEERKDFRIYGIDVADKAARSSGRQAQVKGFLLPPPTVETLRNKKKRLGNPFGKAAASTAGAPSEQEEEMPMTVSHPDKLGILHDKYFKSTRSVYSDTRSWLSHEPLVLSPKTGRSVATRPFLINHGKGALARIANVRNVATWDGGVFRLAEQQDPVVVEKDVLDIRLFAGCAGNAYAMLRMAKANPDTSARWLHRARQLAHLMCDQMESHIGSLGAIDFQLGDGFGGLLAFLIDVLNPHSDEAKFPLFE